MEDSNSELPRLNHAEGVYLIGRLYGWIYYGWEVTAT